MTKPDWNLAEIVDDDISLEELFASADRTAPSKTYAQLAAEGVPIPRWLVNAEEAGVLFDAPTIH